MKQAAGVIGMIWALANLFVAYLFVTNAFVAPTPHKEGFLSQLLLFLGGIALAISSLGLGWCCAKLASPSPTEAPGAADN